MATIHYSGRESGKLFVIKLVRDLIFCVVIVGFFWLIRDVFNYIGKKVSLIEDGVNYIEGVIFTNMKQVPYNNINVVSVSQGILGKIFNYGDLIINTGGDAPEIVFKHLHDPYRFQEAINNRLSD
jgi:uncharacterized membrane protein YdbT with pleckstrin-like domain